MKKQLSLVLIILLSNLCIAQKHVTTYYDYAKIHPKEDYYVNPAGQKNGPYKGYDANGVVVMEYNYLNGNPNGLCIDYIAEANNKRSVAGKVTYKNGVKDGYALEFDPDNHFWTKKREGTYKDGKENGVWRQWWSVEGVQPVTLKSVGKYLNGFPEGLWTFYSQTGKRDSTGTYTGGIQNGTWYYYDKNDTTKIIDSAVYVSMKGPGTWTIYYDKDYNETNHPREYAMYEKITTDNEGHRIWGPFTRYYMTGVKECEGSLIYDSYEGRKKWDGKATWYYPNGKVEEESTFDKGKHIGISKGYFENGAVKFEGEYSTGYYSSGNKIGQWKIYYESGKVKTIEDYGNDSGGHLKSKTDYDENGNKK